MKTLYGHLIFFFCALTNLLLADADPNPKAASLSDVDALKSQTGYFPQSMVIRTDALLDLLNVAEFFDHFKRQIDVRGFLKLFDYTHIKLPGIPEILLDLYKTYAYDSAYTIVFPFDASFSEIEQFCSILGPDTKSIDLQQCKKMQNDGLLLLGKYCPRLESLNLNQCVWVEDDALCSLINGCPDLKALYLDDCYKIGDRALETISEKLPLLSNLSVCNCRQITDNAMTVLARECRLLKCLAMWGCVNVGDDAVKTIVENCKLLTALNLGNMPRLTTAILPLMGPLKNLKHFSITHSKWVKDKALAKFFENCQGLEELCLANCPLGKLSLDALAQKGTKLRILNLSNCQGVDDAAIQNLVVRLKALEVLQLNACDALTDRALEAIAENCRQLSFLEIKELLHVSDKGISALAKSCLQLARIDLGYCTGVTDEALISFSQEKSLALKELGLNGIATLTPKGLQVLLEHCRNIQSITTDDLALKEVCRAHFSNVKSVLE